MLTLSTKHSRLGSGFVFGLLKILVPQTPMAVPVEPKAINQGLENTT